MKAIIQRVLFFPITKMVIGIVVCFLLFVGFQNLVSKPLFYSIIQDKSITDPIIHLISVVILLFSYYCLFRFYDNRKITELSIKHLPKEMFGGFALGFLTISLTIAILYFQGYYQFFSISAEHYSLKLFGLLMLAALIEDLFLEVLLYG